MTILICPAPFKGTLTAPEAARAMARGTRSVHPRAQLRLLPLADGGEGTLDALLGPRARRHRVRVEDPLGRPVWAVWGKLPLRRSGGIRTAVVEMASAAGLRHLSPEQNDLRRASTYGVGQLLRSALDSGCERLVVGLGGSLTNDGGAGALQALGVRLLDARGRQLPRGGAALARLARIDASGLRLPAGLKVVVAADVDSPLCGPRGATRMFGAQKGGSRRELVQLEKALRHYGRVLHQSVGRDVASLPGAGAAGGLGAALMAYLNATVQPGVELVMAAVGFDQSMRNVALVLTGEGQLDEQSARGKAVTGVVRHARGTPVLAICGRVALSEDHWRKLGLAGVGEADAGQRPADAARILARATAQALRTPRRSSAGGPR